MMEVGMWSVYPVVNKTDAASPMALPNESKIAVTNPGTVWRIKTLNAVSERVEPNDNYAS
jgi:hypothetical protein